MPHPETMTEAVRTLQALKAEHRELLLRIVDDEGMNSETKTLLLTHLLEEEDEHLAALAALIGRPQAKDTRGHGGDSRRPGLTVGSLRNDTSADPTSHPRPRSV